MAKKFTEIIGFIPFIILLADGFGVIPEQYQQMAIFAMIATAVLHCVALAKCGEDAMDLALFPALFCVLIGLNAVYDWGKYNVGTVGTFFEAFCTFICGVWIFAYHLKSKKK